MMCVAYARVSSKEQEREGYSIPAQKKLLREYAGSHGLKIEQWFTDIETAKSAGRTDFGKMVAYLKSHANVRVILVEKTDRLYRNFKDYVLLEDLDLEIHLIKENEIINKDSRSHAKFVHGIKVLLAKNYIDNLSEEVKKGMREKAEQGEYPSKAPLGYINDKTTKTIIPDLKRAPLVVRLFELYATGNQSLAKLRDSVYKEGWRTPGGRKIAKSTIEMVLKNPFYTGEFIWKGEHFQGKHEPIISRGLFDQVQKLLRIGNHPRSRRRDFLFRGLLKCEHCGCAIVGEIKKGKYVYYHCTQARGHCDQPWVREEVLDSQMAGVFKAIELNEDTVHAILKALKDNQQKEKTFRESEVKRLKRKHAELQARIDRAYEDRLDGIIDNRYWGEVSGKWRDEQNQVTDRIDQFSSSNQNYMEQALEILELSRLAYSLYLERETAEKRRLLNSVLSNCTYDGLTLYPTYNKPFDLVAEGAQNQIKLPG